MLIPLGTDRPASRPPLVTPALVGLNCAIYVLQSLARANSPEEYARFIRPFLTRPRSFEWFQPLTSAFMHADLWHLLGNMVFLWVFGMGIEDRFGRVWSLVFYVGAAYASALTHVAFENSPALGASGAIAGLTGAFFVLFPRSNVKAIFLLTLSVVWVSAWWIIGLAVVWDVLMQAANPSDGIAHLAHLGGFVYGAGVAVILLGTRLLAREPYDLFTMGKQAVRRRQFREAQRAADKRVEQHWKKSRAVSPAHPSAGSRHDSDALARDRSEIIRLVVAGDLAGAATKYRELIEQFAIIPGATTLSFRHQEQIALHLYGSADKQTAAYAIERLIEANPAEAATPRFKLLLALLSADELNDPIRAKQLLQEVLPALRDEGEQALATRRLADLG